MIISHHVVAFWSSAYRMTICSRQLVSLKLQSPNICAFSSSPWYLPTWGEAGGVAVLPRRCAPLGPGSIPGPAAVRAFGFQSILASAGFSPGSLVFLLHLKLDYLNKSISGIIWSYSASADWQLIWHCVLSPSGAMSRVTKSQIYYLLTFGIRIGTFTVVCTRP